MGAAALDRHRAVTSASTDQQHRRSTRQRAVHGRPAGERAAVGTSGVVAAGLLVLSSGESRPAGFAAAQWLFIIPTRHLCRNQSRSFSSHCLPHTGSPILAPLTLLFNPSAEPELCEVLVDVLRRPSCTCAFGKESRSPRVGPEAAARGRGGECIFLNRRSGYRAYFFLASIQLLWYIPPRLS